MLYAELVGIYEELERHTSKLKKTEIISKFLKKCSSSLIDKVVLLLSGNIYPAWSEEEIGVANKLMIKAISKACGEEQRNVVKYFTKSGDMGKTAEYFVRGKKQLSLLKRTLTINKVFLNLRLISSHEGKGSQERKLNLISELLISASPKEAKYIVKTILGELRIGVAEGIIRDSIAKAFGLKKKVVENAWFLNQDYGEVARIAKEKGERGLKSVKVRIGKPIAVLLAEKSPNLEEAVKKFKRPVAEKKFDGMRTQLHKDGKKVFIFTRRLENVTRQFPELVERARKYVKAEKVILDGETLAVKNKKPLPFQLLSQRIKRKYNIREMSKKIPVRTEFFDIVYVDGKPLFNKTLEERRKILERVIKNTKDFHVTEQLISSDIKVVEKFYKTALKEGHEGLIIKNLDAIYQPGRRVAGGWLKVKPVMENLDLVIVGGMWGTGRRTGWIGSLTLGCRDPETGKFLECGMLGTGIKEKGGGVTFKELTKMLKPLIIKEKGTTLRFKPKIVVEVAYEEIQKSPTYSSGYALRFPRLVRLRDDKGIHEADDIKRIKKLYSVQKGRNR